MAGQKETPRQKMIGMMYLVLTALLAMNVSREVLMGFVTVNESLERTNKSFNESSSTMMGYFKEYVKKDTGSVYYYAKASEAEKLSGDMYRYIETLKKKLVEVTESRSKNEADTSKLRYLDALDNYDVPTYELFGDDETNPKKEEYSAYELRVKLMETHDKLIKLFEGEKIKKKFLQHDLDQIRKKISIIKPIDPEGMVDNVKEDWQMQNFYHLPLAAVVTNLSKIQSDLRNIESETINMLAKSVMTAVPKIDEFSAAVTARTNYIQSGEKYTSEIFLAAGSSTVKREILIGDFDPVTKSFKGESKLLEMGRDGKAIYEAPSSGQGVKTYRGAIKMTKENGEIEWFPFEQEYTVAPPSVAVSADYMNVVYAGIDNPLSVSAAGIASKDLKVTSSSGTLVKTADGKFTIKPTAPGIIKIKVTSQVDGVTKSQGEIDMRVKFLPIPVVKMSGKGGANRTITKGECQGAKYVNAMPENFELSVPYRVQDWTLTIKNQGTLTIVEGSGSTLTEEAKKALSKVKGGANIWIDAEVISPDSRKHFVSTKLNVQ